MQRAACSLTRARLLHSAPTSFRYSSSQSCRWLSCPPVGQPDKWRVLFFGTDNVAVSALKKLLERKDLVSEVSVVCKRPKSAVPEPHPVKQFARHNGLNILQPQRLRDWMVPLSPEGMPYDIAVVVSFGQLIPQQVLRSFRFGGINMHPSLLPRFRGAAPIHHALLNDEKETGVSIIELHPREFDAGRILLQERHPIAPNATFGGLSSELAELGANCLIETLSNYNVLLDSASIQPAEKVSLAPKVAAEMGHIDWTTQSAAQVYRVWRALGDNVGTYCYHGDRRVKLLQLLPPNLLARPTVGSLPEGTVLFDKQHKALRIKCKGDDWIDCVKVQVEARRAVSAIEFANGLRLAPEQQTRFVKSLQMTVA